MYNLRVSPAILENRLDCGFYNPIGLEYTQLLRKNLGVMAISNLVDPDRAITNGVRGPDWQKTRYKLIRLQDCENWIVNFEKAASISLEQFEENKRCRLKVNDIVVAIGGYVGNAAVLNGDCFAVIGQHSAVLPGPEKKGIDSRYLLAYLNSKVAEAIFTRYVSGTVQAGINLEDLRLLPAPVIDVLAQKYVGDKVRQAEQLRAWTKRLEYSLGKFVEKFQPEKKEFKKLCSRVPSNLVTNMLTATTYRERYIVNQKNLKQKASTRPISYFLSSVTNGYDERNEIEEGLPYVKVADVRAEYIDFKNAPRVRRSALTDASEKQKPKKGDLLLTRKGSFGIAAVVMESTDFLCSSEVFSCKPAKPNYMPILSWFLNSEAGNMQFWQFSTGTTMPGINQENLQNILIPDFSDCDIGQFNCIHERRYEAKKCSELLTDAAKTLVEALIEGQLTEQQLIQAQQALEDGDAGLDRAILSKLSGEGFAIEGAKPLFEDLDELYRLLESAAQAEDEE